MEPVIVAQNLELSFGKVDAIRGVSLDVHRGETLAIIGPNGAGKTTLLSLLAGMYFPKAGEVSVFGMDRWKENRTIRLRSAIAPVAPVWGGTSTGLDFVMLMGRIWGVPKEVFVPRLERLVAALDLEPYMRKSVHTLSTGIQKKFSLAAVFVLPVELRMLDEPFEGGIDPRGIEVLHQLIQDARSAGETTIFTTQQLEPAEALADRIAMLRDGLLDFVVTPEELIRMGGQESGSPRALSRAFMALTNR